MQVNTVPRLVASGLFIIFLGQCVVAHSVIADAQLNRGQIVIAVRQYKGAGGILTMNRKGLFIPVSSLLKGVLFQKQLTDFTEGFSPGQIISEGIDANYFDMVNYAVFGLIRLVVEQE